MSEVRMWSYLRQHCPPMLKMYRVNDRLAEGMPDVHWSISPFLSGWFEMKYVTGLFEKLQLRPDQASWLVSYPGLSGVLVRVGSGKDCAWFYFPTQRSVAWATQMRTHQWAQTMPRFEWHGGLRYYTSEGTATLYETCTEQPFSVEALVQVVTQEQE